MAYEIERKFLVTNTSFVDMACGHVDMVQGYLSRNADATVRVRIAGDDAWITVKSRNQGARRHEWEYPIPVEDAREMIEICQGIIEKTRYMVDYAQYLWEIDVFKGNHSGLIVAEVELPSENAPVTLPPFIGTEVTGDPKYYNSNLSNA